MRVKNSDGIIEQSPYDRDLAVAPWLWYDTLTLNGAVGPWRNAPLGSMYWRVASGSVTFYFKAAANNVTADWVALITTGGGQTVGGNLTISGDATVTGTLTAGDIAATAG